MKHVFNALAEIKSMLKQGNLAQKKVLSLNEASDYTGLSKSKLYKLTSNREISFSKPEGKLYFLRRILEKYMLSNYTASKEDVANNVGNYFVKRKADN